MTEQAVFILAGLAGGERHGYGIAQEVEQLSGGRIVLAAGTLYGALNRLSADGLIEATREETVSGRRRRFYRLTGAGETALAREVERLRASAGALSTRVSRPA